MVVEHFWWDTSQLIFKNVQYDVCGTAVSWDLTKLGVPSDAEKVVVGGWWLVIQKVLRFILNSGT